ncbi:LacI family DNA-binding transcriptional regulator [Spirochaetia bacterium 38H-sp]|uniref:LacI family DNA-binding transcriptional regulator n=1 Tax=Rarispira pelagica TaxID=3141764 RepID=A0ABU9UCY7_9SPIR
MPTQKDVAKLAGVSFMTVSRVINNNGYVSEETRKRVEDAIKQLGYSPSFAGKALNRGRTDTIGVMTPVRFGDGFGNVYLLGLIRGIELGCRKYKKDMLFSPFATDDPDFDYLRPYKQKKVDGLIYIGMQSMPEEVHREIQRYSIPCVVIGDRPDDHSISWVDTDNERAGYDSVKRLVSLGHERIGFVGLIPEMYNSNIQDRENGYKRAMRELLSMDDSEKWIMRSRFEEVSVYKAVRERFEMLDRPLTALFCATDRIALGALHAVKDIGLRVPEDVSIIGFDGLIKEFLFNPTIASNEQPLVEMGKRAAEIINRHIENPNFPRETCIFPVYPVDGDTVAPPPVSLN